MWPYYKGKYHRRRDAVEATHRAALEDPRVQFALMQIEAADAYLDEIMRFFAGTAEDD